MPITAEVGERFQVCLPVDYSLGWLRETMRRNFALDIHVEVKFGPTTVDNGVINCPAKAVDDPFLRGRYKFALPDVGQVLCIGHFTELRFPVDG